MQGKKVKYTLYERDLSWLQFNHRVLQEAADDTHSLLERLKFLGIFSNNRDEFYRVRVASLKRIASINPNTKSKETRYTITSLLSEINKRVKAQQEIFEQEVENVFKELNKQNIFLKTLDELTAKQKYLLEQIFERDIKNSVIPVLLKGLKQFPHLQDKSIYLACTLQKDKSKTSKQYALIEVPLQYHNRFIELPDGNKQKCVVLLEDVIRANMHLIFGQLGYVKFNTYLIKITRDAELDIDNDIDVNIINALEKSIKKRRLGDTTRFVYDKEIDKQLLNFLKLKLKLGRSANLIPEGRIIRFKDFMDFPEHLLPAAPVFIKPFTHPQLLPNQSVFRQIQKRDLLLHTPYHTFDSIIDMLREAAIDPKVTDIKITCYRLARQSKIAHTLIQAKRNGKNVIVALEVRARFDESANINWKNVLEEEGITVILGPTQKKLHAKICLITRKQGPKNYYYGFIGTGNLNENTAKVYTDTFLISANQLLMQELDKVFTLLKSKVLPTKGPVLKNLLLSPYTTRSFFTQCIQQEIKNRQKGLPCGIKIKLNSLADKGMINEIYKAAEHGVPVQIIVRGICCLMPNQKGLKANIKVHSIVDSYLEHTRYFIFCNGGKSKAYIGSADWMLRNLDYRVEVSTPILNQELVNEIEHVFDIQWSDSIKSRIVDNAQANQFVDIKKAKKIEESQEKIYFYLKGKK